MEAVGVVHRLGPWDRKEVRCVLENSGRTRAAIRICSRSEKVGKKPPVLVRLLKSSYAEQKYDSLTLVLHSVVAPNETMKNSELGGG